MMWKQFLATLASIIAAVTIGVGLAVVPRMDTLALPSPAASKAAPEEIPQPPSPARTKPPRQRRPPSRRPATCWGSTTAGFRSYPPAPGNRR